MASITLSKFILPAQTVGAQSFTVQYKLATQPASSYVLVDATVNTDTNGNITDSPLPVITGLTTGVLYNVRVTNNCGSPAPYWIENITAQLP